MQSTTVSNFLSLVGLDSAYREQKTHHAQTQQASAHLSDGAVVDLLSVAKAAEQERHAQNQEQIG